MADSGEGIKGRRVKYFGKEWSRSLVAISGGLIALGNGHDIRGSLTVVSRVFDLGWCVDYL